MQQPPIRSSDNTGAGPLPRRTCSGSDLRPKVQLAQPGCARIPAALRHLSFPRSRSPPVCPVLPENWAGDAPPAPAESGNDASLSAAAAAAVHLSGASGVGALAPGTGTAGDRMSVSKPAGSRSQAALSERSSTSANPPPPRAASTLRASGLRERIEKGEKKLARHQSLNKGMLGRAVAAFQARRRLCPALYSKSARISAQYANDAPSPPSVLQSVSPN